MQVSVEEISSVERKLTITVPAERYKETYDKKIKDLAQKAQIKGYRPGKVPESVITQRFGQDVSNESISTVVQEALTEAMKEYQLVPVSTPRVEPKSIAPDKPLEFTASFEILPPIETVNTQLDTIEKLKVDITEKDLERVVSQLQKQYAETKSVDREAGEHDRVLIDYYAIFDGKSDSENPAKNVPLELGGKLMIPGFEEGLLGSKKGEQKHLKLSFPADFTVAEKAGKPVEFIVDIKDVLEVNLPTVDEDFIRKLGVKSGTVEDLHKQIRQTLETERDRDLRERLKDQVFTQLLALNPVEVPKSLVQQEAAKIHDERHPHHKGQHEHNHSDDEMAEFNEAAKKRVALGLILNKYITQTSLKPDKERITKRIDEIASIYEQPDEVRNWLTNDQERRAGIEAQVLEDQILDQLMENVQSSEKTMSYAELKGFKD